MSSLDIGQKVRRARLLARMTQAELAERVGCSRNHLSSIENGVHVPSLRLWLRLQELLKLD